MCRMSRSIVRPTNVAPQPSANASGFTRRSAEPMGVDFVTLPSAPDVLGGLEGLLGQLLPRFGRRHLLGLQELVDSVGNFFARERQASHAVEPDGVHEVLGTEHPDQLATLDLRNENLPIFPEDMT